MQHIINFKLKDFLRQEPELIEEYATIFKYIKPISTHKEIVRLTLRDVDFFKTAFGGTSDADIIKAVAIAEGEDIKVIKDYKILHFFGLVSHIRRQLTEIAKAEEAALTPLFVNKKWEAVGGAEKMAIFGIYNTLDSLTNKDVTKYPYIMDMEYAEVFTILRMRKTADDLQEAMNRIKD